MKILSIILALTSFFSPLKKKPIVLHLEEFHNKYYLPVHSKDSVKMLLLVDTGCEMSLFNSQLLSESGVEVYYPNDEITPKVEGFGGKVSVLKIGRGLRLHLNDSLESKITFKRYSATNKEDVDLNQYFRFRNRGINSKKHGKIVGILGMDMLQELKAEISMQNSTITFII